MATDIDKADPTTPDLRSGTVKKVVTDRGFAFVTDQDGADYFVHMSDCASDFYSLSEGEAVEFTPVTPVPSKGKRATGVKRLSETA